MSQPDAPMRVVAIHGVPRSGTSWIGEVFNSHPRVAYRYQPLFSYAFKGRLQPDSGAADIRAFFAELWATEDDFVLQRGAARLARWAPRFGKQPPTHLVYKEVRYHHVLANLFQRATDIVGIGVVRNPCAVIDSWAHAPREFQPHWDLGEQWYEAPAKNCGREENFYGLKKWKQAARLFGELQQQYPRRFLVLRYEELAADPLAGFARALGHCDLDMSSQVREFILASRERDDHDPYGVFRVPGHERGWRARLPAGIRDAIVSDLRGTELARYLE